jgi:hypothetical protein
MSQQVQALRCSGFSRTGQPCARWAMLGETVCAGHIGDCFPTALGWDCVRILVEARELYVDEIAVERAVMGDAPASLTYAEHAETIRILTRRRQTAKEIGRQLRLTPRSITRYRCRLRRLACCRSSS